MCFLHFSVPSGLTARISPPSSSPCIGSDGTVYVGSSSTTYAGSSYGSLHAFGEWDPTAPETPTITGETQGQYGESYEYIFVSTDPE